MKAINYPHQGDSVTLPQGNVAFPLQGDYVSMPMNVTPMQVTQWNLAYERQLPMRLLMDITYTGSKTNNIWLGYQENPAIYIPGNCQAGQYALTAAGPCSNTSAANLQARALLTLLNPTEGPKYLINGVAQTYDQGTGTYHGVRFGLQKRMSKRLVDELELHASVSASVRASRGLTSGIPSPFRSSIPSAIRNRIQRRTKAPALQTAGTTSICRQCSSLVVSAAASWRTLTKDWQLGLIYQVRSGSALTPSTTGNTALTVTQRPMIVEGVDPNLSEDERKLGESEGAAVVQHGGLRAKPGRRVGQRAQGLPVGTWILGRRPCVLSQPSRLGTAGVSS